MEGLIKTPQQSSDSEPALVEASEIRVSRLQEIRRKRREAGDAPSGPTDVSLHKIISGMLSTPLPVKLQQELGEIIGDQEFFESWTIGQGLAISAMTNCFVTDSKVKLFRGIKGTMEGVFGARKRCLKKPENPLSGTDPVLLKTAEIMTRRMEESQQTPGTAT